MTNARYVHSVVERFVVNMFAIRVSSWARLTLVALVEIGAFTGYFLGHRIGRLGRGTLWINSNVSSIALVIENGLCTFREESVFDVVKLGLYTIDKASVL